MWCSLILFAYQSVFDRTNPISLIDRTSNHLGGIIIKSNLGSREKEEARIFNRYNIEIFFSNDVFVGPPRHRKIKNLLAKPRSIPALFVMLGRRYDSI